MAKTDAELDAIMAADALRYAARTRKENLELGLHKTPRRSRDNVATHDGHKANTFRRFPRTSNPATHPEQVGATHPWMDVTIDGTTHRVPAIPTWREYLPKNEATPRAHTRTSDVTLKGMDWEA